MELGPMNLIIATGSDTKYLPKMDAFLKTVSNFYNGTKILFHVLQPDEVSRIPKQSLYGFESVRMPTSRVLCPSPIKCIQHGAFVLHPCFWEADPNAIVLFMDGDIMMQREFSEEEIAWFMGLKDGQFFLGYNAGPQDNLLTEASRINTTLHKDAANELNFFLWGQMPLYNTGIVAAKVSSWVSLYTNYIKHWDIVDRTFGHYAKQQWLMNYVISVTPEMSFVVMPYSMHTHGHFSTLPEGTTVDSQGLIRSADGKIVLFRHKL
jgi:hypothetical protein